MLTDSIDLLHLTLRNKPALIVHFSGVPKGIGQTVNYPNDLEFALANLTEILCCSTIEPGDFHRCPNGASGSVGVVIGPVTAGGVIFVHNDDVGSPPSTAERRKWDRPTSVSDCTRSFNRNGTFPYNEWLIGPYRVIGLFVAPDAQVQLQNGNYRNKSPADVRADLGQHRVFSSDGKIFTELQPSQQWQPLDMSTIYP